MVVLSSLYPFLRSRLAILTVFNSILQLQYSTIFGKTSCSTVQYSTAGRFSKNCSVLQLQYTVKYCQYRKPHTIYCDGTVNTAQRTALVREKSEEYHTAQYQRGALMAPHVF